MWAEDCAAVGVVPTFTAISLEEVGSSVTQQSSAKTGCLTSPRVFWERTFHLLVHDSAHLCCLFKYDA